jgi:hypothetical protein
MDGAGQAISQGAGPQGIDPKEKPLTTRGGYAHFSNTSFQHYLFTAS